MNRLAFAAVLVVLSACGDGATHPSPLEREALTILVEGPTTSDERSCLLDGLDAGGVPAETIVEGTLTPAQDTTATAVTVACIEDLGRIPSFVASFIEGASLEGVELTEAQARCAIDSLSGSDADAITAVTACLGADPGTLEGAATYGEDPLLDLLWEACDGGNSQACDELFWNAPTASGYGEFGRTCGGLLPDGTGGRCFDELDLD